MFIPPEGIDYISNNGMNLEQWQKMVAQHEASHAAICLYYGGFVEAIHLNYQAGPDNSIPAYILLNPNGMEAMYVITVSAAGPASDLHFSESNPVPEALLKNIHESEFRECFESSKEYLSESIFESMWKATFSDAYNLLKLEGILNFVNQLTYIILHKLDEGVEIISGKIINELWGQSFN